jgi:hypothetical protein
VRANTQLVDVGQQAVLDGSDSFDPDKGDELTFFWTLLRPPGSHAFFQTHCESDSVAGGADEICTTNDDKTCTQESDTPCVDDGDCPEEGDTCNRESGTMSSQCPADGRCDVGDAQTMDYATFIADVGGTYNVRMLTESDEASAIAPLNIFTNPSLFVVGSLLMFGGTQGGFVLDSEDAESFAANAVAGVGNPINGNVLLAVVSPGRVREFTSSDATIVGTFGETDDFLEPPRTLAFDGDDDLNVIYVDGLVRVFDGENGLYIRLLGDVTAGGEQVAATAFSPNTGELFVVDGQAGAPLRVYTSDGDFSRVLPDTATAVNRSIDLAFVGSPATDLLIADVTGRIVRCNPNGTGCGDLGNTATLLAGSVLTGIAVNPAIDAPTNAAILVSDFAGQRVVGCSRDGSSCGVFGQTGTQPSNFLDVFFAPPTSATTTTTTIPTSSTTTTTVEPQSIAPGA